MGDFTFLASATDDTGDTPLYRFEAQLQGGGAPLVRDFDASDTAVFPLTVGVWDVTVEVDDSLSCNAEVNDTCTLQITVNLDCPESGEEDFEDTLCTSFSITAEPGGDLEGSYTVTASASDTSGDTPIFTFTADNGIDAPTVMGPSTTDNATFNLGPGDWVLSCVVDDDLDCNDDAARLPGYGSVPRAVVGQHRLDSGADRRTALVVFEMARAVLS